MPALRAAAFRRRDVWRMRCGRALGPRRASAGALRDFVLGVKLIDGRGRVLQFGGQVMKNVAGYDVSRLVAGSLGTLGLIAEASLKVLPRPSMELTLRLVADETRALDAVHRCAPEPLPLFAPLWPPR